MTRLSGAVRAAVLGAGLVAVLAGCGGSSAAPGGPPRTAPHIVLSSSVTRTAPTATGVRAARVPRPKHVVVVVEENHAAAEVLGNPDAPYIDALARTGASFTHSYAITHPSEPNYLALFSGSTQGLTDDSCPHRYRAPNLGSQLRAAGLSFRGYAEGLPGAGSTACSAGEYARKHVPWTDFAGLPRSVNQPFSAFPREYAALPALSFVIPDLEHDMHDGTIAQADDWLRRHLGGYVRWARSHDSLLVLTWDEDDSGHGNRIPTVVAGAHVRPGRYGEHVTHYRMLRTLEALEGLPPIAQAAGTTPITGIWK